jgi:transposase
MTKITRLVTGGVDAHTDSHHAAALDERGQLLGDAAFATNLEGYHELLAWLDDQETCPSSSSGGRRKRGPRLGLNSAKTRPSRVRAVRPVHENARAAVVSS